MEGEVALCRELVSLQVHKDLPTQGSPRPNSQDSVWRPCTGSVRVLCVDTRVSVYLCACGEFTSISSHTGV